MSLRDLPDITALQIQQPHEYYPPGAALDRWDTEIRAAVNGRLTIDILDVIGEDFLGEGVTSRRVAAELKAAGELPVTVNINSPGGDFFEGIAIYSLLRAHPANVTVNVVGIASSAASVIAMAGDNIRISAAGFMMIHNAKAIGRGDHEQLRAIADALEEFTGAMAGLYAARSGTALESIKASMKQTTFYNAEAAIAAGLADELIAETELTHEPSPPARALSAERRIEAKMIKDGTPRAERRSLIAEVKAGTPGAAPKPAPDIGAWKSAAQQLFETMKPKKPKT